MISSVVRDSFTVLVLSIRWLDDSDVCTCSSIVLTLSITRVEASVISTGSEGESAL